MSRWPPRLVGSTSGGPVADGLQAAGFLHLLPCALDHLVQAQDLPWARKGIQQNVLRQNGRFKIKQPSKSKSLRTYRFEGQSGWLVNQSMQEQTMKPNKNTMFRGISRGKLRGSVSICRVGRIGNESSCLENCNADIQREIGYLVFIVLESGADLTGITG